MFKTRIKLFVLNGAKKHILEFMSKDTSIHYIWYITYKSDFKYLRKKQF